MQAHFFAYSGAEIWTLLEHTNPGELRSIPRIPTSVPTELFDWVLGRILNKAAELEREAAFI